MKRFLQFLLLIILLFAAFAFHKLYSTGFFRNIEPHFEGEIVQKVPIVGAEDMTISYSGDFLLISSDDRASAKKGQVKQGGIYFINLKDKGFRPKLISQNFDKEFRPHGISLLQLDSVNYQLLVINHTSSNHFIEVFHLRGDSLTHLKSLNDEQILSPNDVLAVSENTFYFTNDHGYTSNKGRLAEDYLGLKASNVVYFDGTKYREVASGIAYANGINWLPNQKLLFVTSPSAFLTKVYQIGGDGSLDFIENIDCKTGVDNIEIDPNGNLWIGAHPNLMAFANYANLKQDKSPSEVLKINYRSKGNYVIKNIMIDDGTNMSASSVAVSYKNYIFLGNVMDQHFLIVKKNTVNQ